MSHGINAKEVMESIPAACRVRVREGGGPENIHASLAVSVYKMARQLADKTAAYDHTVIALGEAQQQLADTQRRAEEAERQLASRDDVLGHCVSCGRQIRRRDGMITEGDRSWHPICKVGDRAAAAEARAAEYRAALTKIADASTRPNDWDARGEEWDDVASGCNSGDIRDYGEEIGMWLTAKIARAALTHPTPPAGAQAQAAPLEWNKPVTDMGLEPGVFNR